MRTRLIQAALTVPILWALGLVWFAGTIPDSVADPASPTDAIVVLTGGSQRLENGLDLLASGMARKLFISGVHPGVQLPQILHEQVQHGAVPKPDWINCCIVLGYAADNTVGNAIETALWIRSEGFRSLRLVTGSYHMRRSLLEFSRAMPEVAIIPHPVFSDRVKLAQWWEWPGTANLIVGEYHKYLMALLHLAVFHFPALSHFSPLPHSYSARNQAA